MIPGYAGKIVHVDLTSQNLDIEFPADDFYWKFIGGSAMGLYYLLKQFPVSGDALGPENILTVFIGPLAGAPISGQSRMAANAKSPLTEGVGDSQAGGFFPAKMKFAGIDGLVITGRAPEPCYILIDNGEPSLRPANHLWGKGTAEVEEIIRNDLGDKNIELIQCGPAGENKVRFASIMTMSNRAFGRTGLGAVMGSKNLKAVVVRGDVKPSIADKDGLLEISRWGAKEFEHSAVYGLGMLGTAEIVELQNSEGGLPTQNWKSGVFKDWKALDGSTMANTILKARDTCYACAIRCKRVVESTEEPYLLDPVYGGPEYETLATLGSYCGVGDLKAVAYANQLCNMYGMDTISCGGTIAWAMECFEEGLLDTTDTGGIELRFGNAEAMVEIVELIATRKGFGDILAEGSDRASKKIGRGTSQFLATVKRQELPAHMPQVKRSLSLIYATNPFGPDHQSSEHDPSYSEYPERMAEIGLVDPQPDMVLNNDKVHYAYITQCLYACLDSIPVCQFVFGPAWQLFSTAHLVKAIKSVTGWDITISDLLEVGERRLNMMRAFNALEGIDSKKDVLPEKLFKPLRGGVTDGISLSKEELVEALTEYYFLAGWEKNGIPTRGKLEELELGWIADRLEKTQ